MEKPHPEQRTELGKYNSLRLTPLQNIDSSGACHVLIIDLS